jgi:hypothetical protein
MRTFSLPFTLAATLLGTALGCTTDDTIEVGPGDTTKAGDDKSDSSVEAVIVDFEFDGELFTDFSFSASQQVKDQLLFTMGQLNGSRGVARLDLVALSNLQTAQVGGRTHITYHAKVPVAWGKRSSVPASYELILPSDMSSAGQEAFFEKYKAACVDGGTDHMESGNFWYFYRPAASGCHLVDAEVVKTTATVSLSALNTTGKYPEYHEVWKDGVLNVVAVFGKYDDAGMDASDAGISAYNSFVRAIRAELAPFNPVTIPATVPSAPGVSAPDITVDATLPDGRKVHVTALLTNQIRSAPPSFDTRYSQVTPNADYLSYNGHSGLGANIRALTQKGSWQAGQYTLAFINGCDTYSYVDSSLAQARAQLNADDPTGSKHLDIATNAMPSFFASNANNNIIFIRSLMNIATPKSYEQIFTSIDRSQVIVVSGEQDNVFVPGFDPNGGGGTGDANWAGMTKSGSVARDAEVRFTTPKLAAGSYRFTMTGTSDADLYVKIGQDPTRQVFDCRPFLNGSNETCNVDLGSAAEIHVMVRGWNASSTFSVTGAKQ